MRQTGSFSVTDPFLTFYYVEKRNGMLCKNRGEGFEKSYVPLHGSRGGVKNSQNLPYVMNEWPLLEIANTCIIETFFLCYGSERKKKDIVKCAVKIETGLQKVRKQQL